MEETYGLQDYSDGSTVRSRDPVCGAPVDEANAPEKTGYAGVIYYFCSADCRKKFEEEPSRYAGARA